MNYKTTDEFDKDFKKLFSRFSTLEQDFEILKKYHIEPFHKNGITGPISLSGLGDKPVYKIKKIACKSLKSKGSNSGLRVIYTYDESVQQVTFTEIYFKGDQRK